MTVIWRGAVSLCLVVTMGGAWAQGDGGNLSDAERAKRDAQKVFSFIKFSTVKAPKDKDKDKEKDAKEVSAKAAPAKPSSPPARSAERSAERPAAVAAAPASATAAVTETVVPLDTTQTATQPAQAVTLPAVAEPQPQVPVVSAPVVEEPDEVELKLVHYVAPEMNRQVMEAMAERAHIVPVRFVVGTDGKVMKAEPKPGANRRLGQAAAPCHFAVAL